MHNRPERSFRAPLTPSLPHGRARRETGWRLQGVALAVMSGAHVFGPSPRHQTNYRRSEAFPRFCSTRAEHAFIGSAVALCASVLPNRLHPIPKPRSGRQWGHFDHDSHAILRLSGFNVRAFSDRLGRLKRGWQRQKWALRSAPSARDRSDLPPLLMACTRQVILPSFTYSLHSVVPSRYRCHVGVQSKPHAVVTTAQTPTPGRTRGCGVCDNMAGLEPCFLFDIQSPSQRFT